MNSENRSDIVIHTEDLTKSYGTGDVRVMALRGVDIDVLRGELMMVVGPSGCGKTTFVSILGALLAPDGGTCELFGLDIEHLPHKEKTLLRRERIGFVFQAFNLLPALSLQENVAVPLLVQGMARTQAMKRATETLGQVGMEARLDALPSQISGGQKQRVAIARALVHRPQLIICDEPTSNLDHETGQNVMNLLRRLMRTEQTTVLVVTHDNRILGFADRIAHMDDGRILKVETVTKEHSA